MMKLPISLLILMFVYLASGIFSIFELISEQYLDLSGLLMLIVGALLAYRVKFGDTVLQFYVGIQGVFYFLVFVFSFFSNDQSFYVHFFGQSVEIGFWLYSIMILSYLFFQAYVAFYVIEKAMFSPSKDEYQS